MITDQTSPPQLAGWTATVLRFQMLGAAPSSAGGPQPFYVFQCCFSLICRICHLRHFASIILNHLLTQPIFSFVCPPTCGPTAGTQFRDKRTIKEYRNSGIQIEDHTRDARSYACHHRGFHMWMNQCSGALCFLVFYL